MNWLSILLRPLIALAFFSLVALIAWPIRKRVRRMREGRLKRTLLQPVSVQAAQASWWPTIIWGALAAALWGGLLILATAKW